MRNIYVSVATFCNSVGKVSVLIAPCAYSTFLLNTPYGVKGGYASLITLGWEGGVCLIVPLAS